MSSLSVDLNRDGLYEIAVPQSFEADGPFEVRLRNHGEAIHVHLNVDDELSKVTRLAETNHYVEPYGQRSVHIETQTVSTAVTGRLKIVTGYGTNSTYTTVKLSPPGTVTNRVLVDESLAKPHRPDPEPPSLGEQAVAAVPDAVSLRGVAVIAATIAAIAVGALAANTAVLVGSLVVVGLLATFVVAQRS